MRATVLSPRHISVLLAAVTILGLVLMACGDGRNTSPPPAAEATAGASGPGPTAIGSTCTDAGGLSQRHRHAGASANSHALSYYGAVSRTGLDAWPARRDLREGGRLLGPRSRSPSVRPD